MNIAISEERNKHNLLKDFKIYLPKILNTRASNVLLILKKKKAKTRKRGKKKKVIVISFISLELINIHLT